MQRGEVRHLQYIASIRDLPSILELDIWCRSSIRRSMLRPGEVADPDVVARRDRKSLPREGRGLDEYVPLYFNARNAMLYSLRERWQSLAVLSVSAEVLDLPGVRVSPQNAAAGDRVWDRNVASALPDLHAAEIYATTWIAGDLESSQRAKRRMQAEALVPRHVPSGLISSAAVCDEEALAKLRSCVPDLQAAVDPWLFFGQSS